MGDPYIFAPSDQAVVKSAIELLTKIYTSSLVVDKEKKQIWSLIKILSEMPAKSYGATDAMVILHGPKRYFEERTISHSWTIEARDAEISVNSSGYFSRPATGGDSFTSFTWQAYPNCDTDSCDYSAMLGLIDDAQPFHDEINEIDLTEPGFKLTVSCDRLPRFSSKQASEETVSKNQLLINFDPLELPDQAIRDAQLISEAVCHGYTCLAFLKETQQKLSFDLWKQQMNEVCSGDDILSSNVDLLWLWGSLKNCTRVKENIGKLSGFGSNKARGDNRLECLPAGARFDIGFKPKQVKQLVEQWPMQKPKLNASVEILEPLKLKNGKAGRLECCEVQSKVTLKVGVSHTAEKEADIMRIAPEKVDVIDSQTVSAEVMSLNQAYTVASRRLEPDRRSHGGRVYDHFVYTDSDSSRYLLEDIRSQVEQGTWALPSRGSKS